jgi:hypothetical protein
MALCSSCIICFMIHEGFGQNNNKYLSQPVSVSVQDVPLKEVLKSIERQTKTIFSYNNSLINVEQNVTYAFEQLPLDEVLKSLFNNSVNYYVVSNNIILQPFAVKEKMPAASPVASITDSKKVLADTVIVYKTDTVLIQVTDTLIVKEIVYQERIVLDTIYIRKQTETAWLAGLVYEALLPRFRYDRFGTSDRASSLKRLADSPAFSQPISSTVGVLLKGSSGKWELTTGLAYQRLQEKFDFSNDPDSLMLRTIFPFDSVSVASGNNSYSYLSIPVIVGHIWPLNQEWTVTVSVGCRMNYNLKSKGYFLDMEPVDGYYRLSPMHLAPLRRISADFSFGATAGYLLRDELMLQMGIAGYFPLITEYKEIIPYQGREQRLE